MTCHFARTLLATAATAALYLTASTSAMAGDVQAPTCNLISGGGVTVKECVLGIDGTYAVTNNSGTPIYGFMVSTRDISTGSSFNPTTIRSNWQASKILETDFTQQFGFLGQSFDDLFGTTDRAVFYYHYVPPVLNIVSPSTAATVAPIGPILSDNRPIEQFYFKALPSSNFVALSQSNTVVAQSFAPAAVPEAASYSLMALGLASLAAMTRRRVNKAG